MARLNTIRIWSPLRAAFSEASHLKVAMVIDFYPPVIGGAEVQMAALTPRLRAAGVDVRVVTRAVPGLPGFELLDSVPVFSGFTA